MRYLLAALALGAFLLPQAPAQGGGAGDLLVVRASRYDKGDGSGLRKEKVRLLVSRGKIRSLEMDQGPLPQGCKVLAEGPVLVPGLVASATDLAGTAGEQRPVTPGYLAAWAALDRGTRKRILRGGITTFHLAPGRDRFLPGQGVLLRPGSAPGTYSLLKSPADLFLVLGERGKMRSMVFDPVVFPDETHLLKPAQRMMPSSLGGQVLLARRLFALAADPKGPRTFREGRREYSLEPLRRAARRKLPVRFVCDSSAAVRAALSLAKEFKLQAVIEDLRPGGGPVSEFAGWKPLAVVVRLPFKLWGPDPGDPDRTRPIERPDPSYAARLHAAGIPVILAPASDQDLGSLFLAAGAAVRAGLPAGAALRALTLEPARALGVSSRVGSLERGKDADFLLLSGDPFDAGTSILGVFRAGKPVEIAPPKTKPLLAIQAGRVHLGDGRVLEPGTILIEKGKIVAAAKVVALPPGTRLIDRPGAEVTPGFLDADSRLGLRASSSSRLVRRRLGAVVVTRRIQSLSFPRLGPDADLGLLVRPGGPGFLQALRSGVTAVLVAGAGGAGRGSLYKTAVEKKPLASIAALHFPLSSLRSLQGNLARAEAYLKKLEAWKKAYAAWRKKRFGPASRPARPFRAPPKAEKKAPPKGGAPSPASKPASKSSSGKTRPAPAPPGAADPVSGTWQGSVSGLPRGKTAPCILRLRLRGERVTGLFQGPFRFKKGAPPVIPLRGRYKDGTLDLKTRTRSGQTLFELRATVTGEDMEGTWSLLGGRMKGTFKAHREKKPAAPVWEEIPPGGPELVLEEIDDDVDLSEVEVDPELGDFTAPLPPLPPPGLAALAAADPVSGTWKGELEGIPRVGKAPFTAKLTLSGEKVTGSVTLPFHRRGGPPAVEIQGTYSGGVLRMSGKRIPIRMEASLGKDRMEGNWSLGPFKGTFTAERVEKPKGGEKAPGPAPEKPKAAPTGAPARPEAGASLEPWVGVLRGETSLILHPAGPAALAEALPYLAKRKPRIRVIVAGGPAARKNLEALKEAGAAVLVEPGGKGPAAYARAGVPVLFGSGSAQGTRWIPFYAAYAVSKGMEKEDALEALTSWPARYLGAGKRIGSLLPGRDADLVIWTGDPFDMNSRISAILVSGKVVFQNHE